MLDQRGDYYAIGGKSADRGFLIVAHEAAVVRHARAEDRCQLALHVHPRRLLSHRASLSSRGLSGSEVASVNRWMQGYLHMQRYSISLMV